MINLSLKQIVANWGLFFLLEKLVVQTAAKSKNSKADKSAHAAVAS